MTTPSLCRSALYLPASNPRAIAKARGLPCDIVILDLEDAVAPEQKADARRAAVEAARQGGFGRRCLVLRINALDTAWGADDLSAARGAPFDAVLVPKVSSAAEIAAVERALAGAPQTLRIWAMIETCRAMLALDAIGQTAAATRLDAWVIGTNDLAREMRSRPTADRAQMLPLLTMAIVAARAWGLDVFDGVSNAIDDPDRLVAECGQAATMGFDGKTLIHPNQIAACNAAFSPDDAALDDARAIVAAFAAPGAEGRGAIRLDGRMVELLHRDEARRTLAIADAIAAAERS